MFAAREMNAIVIELRGGGGGKVARPLHHLAD